MRRRLHLVPLTFVPPKPDPDLAELLKGELPGILAWAIRGCLAWQRMELNPPPVVTEASAEYFETLDRVATWLEERCERVPDAKALSRRLFTDWAVWSKTRNEETRTEKWFSEALSRHVGKRKTAAGMAFLGLRLRPAEQVEAPL